MRNSELRNKAMSTITKTIFFETVNCSCGGTYAVNKTFYDSCRERGGGWHCPYCQNQTGWTETDNDRLKKQIAAVEREKERLGQSLVTVRQQRENALAEAEHFRKSRDGMKGALVKVKKRISGGVCPCCNRTFASLARHMKSQHPNFHPEEKP